MQDMSMGHTIDSSQYYSMGNPSYLAEPYYYDMMRYPVNYPPTSDIPQQQQQTQSNAQLLDPEPRSVSVMVFSTFSN